MTELVRTRSPTAAVRSPADFEILDQRPGPVKADTVDARDLKSGTRARCRPRA